MKLTSPAFKHNEMIPKKYTCDDKDINPPLKIEYVPEKAESLALIVDDPDAPSKTWVHWVVYNIPKDTQIDENSIPGRQGINDFNKMDYGGPCPPSGKHRYFFKIYALDQQLNLEEGISKHELEHAMEAHILANAELIGIYER